VFVDDDGGALCLTWRRGTLAITLEVRADGSEEWWAYSRMCGYIEGRGSVAGALQRPK
jgi:hypothetical protein